MRSLTTITASCGNPNDLTNAVRKYAEAAEYSRSYQGPGMFGDIPEPQTPAQAFDASFGEDAVAAEEKAKAEAKAAKAAAKSAGKDATAPVSDAAKPRSGRTLKGALKSKGGQTDQK